ncbi:MAG: alpha-2-macroglobulin family protein [Pseudomonadota bacterium]
MPRTTLRRAALWLASIIGLAVIALGTVALADPASLRGMLATRPVGAGGGTVVVPDVFLRRWDPVTIFYAADEGPAGGGPEDHPERHARMSPEQPGAWTWLDARTLQFKPAEPWPALATFTWKAGGARAELATLMSPPLSSVPSSGAEGLDPVEAITLTFAEPMEIGALARMLTVELRALPGAGGPPDRLIRRGDFEIKALERQGPSDPATYVLTLDDPIPLGTRATVRFQLALVQEEEASFSSFSFATAEPFRVAGLGCSRTRYPVSPDGGAFAPEQAIRCDASRAEVWVDFTARPADLGPVQGRSLVRFDPAVEGLEYTVSGSRLIVKAAFERDVPYKVSVVPTALADQQRRPLELRGESSVWLIFPHQPPYLRMSAGQGILERQGPQTIPLEGRGQARADLRIYRIDPLDRSFWPFPAGPVTVEEDDRPPGPGEEPQPFTSASGTINAWQLAAQIDALGTPARSTVVELPLAAGGNAARFGLDLGEELAWVSGRGQPGTYLVGVRSLDGASSRAWMRLQVTDLALTTVEKDSTVLFLVSSLSSGRGLAGARVRIEGVENTRFEEHWATLAEGSTGADGTFRWEAPGSDPQLRRRARRIVVEREGDVLVMNADDPPERYHDNLWGGLHSTWLQWGFESLGGRQAPVEDLCHIFTERPVYRPEEPVHIKGWARRRTEGRLSPIQDRGLLEVQGPGDLSWTAHADSSATGGFYHKFAAEDLPSGAYTATWTTSSPEDGDTGFHARCSVTWKMEAYRLPRFEVDLAGPDTTPLDREFAVKLDATYYAGGQVAGRPVRWRVSQYPYAYQPKAREGFLFSSDGRYGHGRRFETTPALDRATVTDATGHASLSLDPTVEPTAHPRTYVVEATVTGDDDQTVTATRQIVALPAFVLGLSVPRFLEHAESIPVGLIAVGPDDTLLPGQEVTVRLAHRAWHSRLQAGDFSDGVARYVTDVVDEPVSEQVVTTGSDTTRVELPIMRAGVYVVEIEAHDRLGRVQVVSVDLYAGGEEAVTWARPATKTFSLTADKDRYRPGESAALVFQSPYQKARALVIVEAPDGNRYDWVDVRGGTATYRVPIDKTWTPRVPIHAVLMRGRLDDDRAPPRAVDLDLGKPATVAATAWLAVEPVGNQVEVALQNPEKARPGETVDVTITLKDPEGKPLGGELTLWLVDQAVLSLGHEQRLDPLPDFITPVRSRLNVLDTRNLVLGRLPFSEMPGGDGGDEDNGGPLDKATVRKDFQPVPYYEPALVVPATGKLTVRVKLPDNLTNFKIRAKVAAGPDRFGYAKGQIAVRLPVIVQPDLPRFVRPGDQFEAAAIGRVVEGEGGAGHAEIKVEGLDLKGKSRAAVALDPVNATHVGFPVAVQSPGYDQSGLPTRREVTLTVGLSRSSDGASDAFQVSLPLRPDRFPVAQRQLQLLAGGEQVEIPALAESPRAGTLRRTVLAAREPGLVHVASGMDFLLRYPYGCTEQRVSQARAYLAIGKLRSQIHLERDPKEVDAAVAETLAWITDVQGSSGLVSFWPGGTFSVWLSAWTLEFLVEAREAGYRVDDRVFDALVRGLQQALRSDDTHLLSGWSWHERAWALEALAGAGQFDRGYFAELGRKSNYLDAEGMAEVLLAGARAGQADSPTSKALVEKVAESTLVRLYQGREIYGGLQQIPHGPGGGLILSGETRTIATMARALARVAPESPKLALLYGALATLGRTDGWGDTNANAAAMLALSERLAQPQPKAPQHTVSLSEDGVPRQAQLGPTEPMAFWSVAGTGALAVTHASQKGGEPEPILVRADAFYLPAPDGSQEEAKAQGFVVQRVLERVLAGGTPSEKLPIEKAGKSFTFAVGEVVEDHVQVVNPEDRYHVAIVVPMAAGMEPMNPTLATAPPEATPSARPTLAPSYADYADDEVAFFYDHLPKGTYDFRFRVRAFTPGRYVQPAARAEQMYDASVRGNTPGARIVVERE